MGTKLIFEDEFIKLTSETGSVMLESFKKGYSMEQLNSLLSNHHEIEITNFNVLRDTINNAPKAPGLIGRMKEKLIIDISDGGLSATVTVNAAASELAYDKRPALISEIKEKITSSGIVFGIDLSELIKEELISGKSYKIASGIPPVNGTDAVVEMFNIDPIKPIVMEEGKADYYHLKLINKVNAGAWLGQKTAATLGTPGKTVKAEVIPPQKGKDLNLYYDRNSVSENVNGDITKLVAVTSGAVKYVDGKITVMRLLEIDGDVDFKTGNIEFDGYVTIKGTIADSFSVEASKDIEINGNLGVGNVKKIISTKGSIFIKGGIASRSNSQIVASGSIFTKFVENASITCGEIAHIGFYSVNSNINAREVIVEASGGRIIGGNIKAKIKISVPILGNEAGRRTVVEVVGFDRRVLNDELVQVIQRINEMKQETQRAKQLIVQLSAKGQINPSLHKETEEMVYKLTSMKEEMKVMDEKRKALTEYLKARGDGELSITKTLYSNCQIVISKNILEINDTTGSVTYYMNAGELMTLAI